MDTLSWICGPDTIEELEVMPDVWAEHILQLVFIVSKACVFLLFACFVANPEKLTHCHYPRQACVHRGLCKCWFTSLQGLFKGHA